MLKITLGLSIKVIASIFPQGKGGNKPFQSDKPEGFLQVERYDTISKTKMKKENHRHLTSVKFCTISVKFQILFFVNICKVD